MELFRQELILPLPSFVASVALWMASSSSSSSGDNLGENCTQKLRATNPFECIDNPCFRANDNNDKTCDWIGSQIFRKQRYCKKRKVTNHCPIACEMEACTNNNNSYGDPPPPPNTNTKAPSNGTLKRPPSKTPPGKVSLVDSPKSTARESSSLFYPRGKKGVCFTLREKGKTGSYTEDLPKMRALNPSWAYSWGPGPPDGVPVESLLGGGIEILPGDEIGKGFDYVPMLWGYYPKLFEDSTDQILGENPRMILGFNEPDSSSQSSLAVDLAIEGWERLARKVEEAEESMNTNVLLVGPSCVHSRGSWCRSFIEKADERGLKLDAIGVHWYGGASPEALINELRQTHEAYGKRPILLTEFAVADWNASSKTDNRFTPGEVLAFMEEVLPWLEATEWIVGYAWFSFKQTSRAGWVSALVEGNNNGNDESESVVLTPLGKFYSDFPGNEITTSMTGGIDNIFRRQHFFGT